MSVLPLQSIGGPKEKLKIGGIMFQYVGFRRYNFTIKAKTRHEKKKQLNIKNNKGKKI